MTVSFRQFAHMNGMVSAIHVKASLPGACLTHPERHSNLNRQALTETSRLVQVAERVRCGVSGPNRRAENHSRAADRNRGTYSSTRLRRPGPPLSGPGT